MSDPTLVGRMAELVNRIGALEAERCDCPSCTDRRRERELDARRRRFVEIAAMPDAERAVAIDALDSYTRAAYLFSIAPADAVATVIGRCERLDRAEHELAIGELVGPLRDHVRQAFARVPALVELSLRPGRVWGAYVAEISPSVADRLAALGITRGIKRHSTYSVYQRQLDLANGVRAILSTAELAALREADTLLDSEIAAGYVVVRELSDDEVRAHMIELRRVSPPGITGGAVRA